VYGVPKEEFNKIHETQEIVGMAANIGRYYEDLHQLNCRKELGQEVPLYEHKKAIWLALNASYALEALRFMVSFATSLAMVENKIYIGNGNIISLILQDELLHTEWTGWLINNVTKDDPDFLKLEEECAEEVYAMYMEVIREEKDWADYLFKKGVVIGLNSQILKDFVDYTAFTKLKEIGVKYLEDHPKTSPIPWFNKHVNINKKQTALQENESTNYVIGVMSDQISYEELPDL
jgi:ribonucleoside-diphosphate reductase beta chain